MIGRDDRYGRPAAERGRAAPCPDTRTRAAAKGRPSSAPRPGTKASRASSGSSRSSRPVERPWDGTAPASGCRSGHRLHRASRAARSSIRRPRSHSCWRLRRCRHRRMHGVAHDTRSSASERTKSPSARRIPARRRRRRSRSRSPCSTPPTTVVEPSSMPPDGRRPGICHCPEADEWTWVEGRGAEAGGAALAVDARSITRGRAAPQVAIRPYD